MSKEKCHFVIPYCECVIKRCAKWSIPLDRWKRLNLSRPSTCFTKQSFDATQKKRPKIKSSKRARRNFPSANFPRAPSRDSSSIVTLRQFKPRWPIRVCETESTFSRTKYSKKRNQSTNKEQQITATAQIPSIATKNKFSYNNNNKERKKRSEAEIDSRGDFQHRISPVRFSSGARRTRNEIFYQKQKSRWGLVSVSWWGGPRSIGNYAEMVFNGRKIEVRLWKVCSVFSIYWYFCVRIK